MRYFAKLNSHNARLWQGGRTVIHSRHLGKQIMVLVLLSSSLALATSPATAQTGLDVYSFLSQETAPDNDGDAVWTVQITVESAAGCTPTEEEGGSAGYVSGWLGAGDSPARVLLNTDVCNYRITAVARNSKSPGMRCEAGLAWGDVPMPTEDYLDTRIKYDQRDDDLRSAHDGLLHRQRREVPDRSRP